ncbi:thioredoxin TrxA [Candidatus Erwinia haradaeae]|uniref:Thioredoxin n=1 Tax=Candidatus Erwinia haradaeae TaxID=1922217 RepID=A0A451DFZ0_9GAMM|nr:thioredoxin TrxA [Candidatus Erwinia haradaeae]VFP85534.1 Thioredoxin 1 [Candidatus Erwinia haradaeae]
MIHLTDENFDSIILNTEGLILVDFWAEWCGPCKMIAPILDEIDVEYKEKLIVAKFNVDQNSNTTPKYGIRSIPTLLLFKNGLLLDTKVGVLSKSNLSEFLNQHCG